MITRDVAQIFVVPALVVDGRLTDWTVAGLSCYQGGATSAIGSSEFFPGFVIDQKGLPHSYRAMTIAPVIHGVYGSTADLDSMLGVLSAGVMHASASGGTYTAYSTGSWLVDAGLWRQTTATACANLSWSAVQRDVGKTSEIGIGGILSTTTSSALGQSVNSGTSSTGFIYYAGRGPVFDMTGAKRFIKCVVRPHIQSDGCAAGSFHLSAAAVFGEPDVAMPNPVSKRILVTSGCAT